MDDLTSSFDVFRERRQCPRRQFLFWLLMILTLCYKCLTLNQDQAAERDMAADIDLFWPCSSESSMWQGNDWSVLEGRCLLLTAGEK